MLAPSRSRRPVRSGSFSPHGELVNGTRNQALEGRLRKGWRRLSPAERENGF